MSRGLWQDFLATPRRSGIRRNSEQFGDLNPCEFSYRQESLSHRVKWNLYDRSQIGIAPAVARGLNSRPDRLPAEAPTPDRRQRCGAFSKGERAMNIRLPRLATTILMVAVSFTDAGRCWAVYNLLGPSKDEWGLKYDVQVGDAGGGTLSVKLTLADEGRLKPIATIELIAFSKETDSQGGHSYDVKAPFVLKPTRDGRRGAIANPQGVCRPRPDSDPRQTGRWPTGAARLGLLRNPAWQVLEKSDPLEPRRQQRKSQSSSFDASRHHLPLGINPGTPVSTTALNLIRDLICSLISRTCKMRLGSRCLSIPLASGTAGPRRH